ncbi:MAG TPA: MBL fold metallo-hydrolase [Noviherbaspirillum sp.]|uniref:MBL fold metallo-hydrolase n=1 Tax=Noviherbaspirillum sp. TaxID=1926288 RepID=UPI002F92D0C4
MRRPPIRHAALLAALLYCIAPGPYAQDGQQQPQQPQQSQPSQQTPSQGETRAPVETTLELAASAKPARAATGGTVQFIGNATVLIRYGDLTILTDPNFLHKGDHVHLGYGLKSQRLTDPAIPFDKLPAIDLVLLSHLHGDHFDQLVQQKMRRDVPIVTTPEAAEGLRELGFEKRHALRHWDSLLVRKGGTTLRITGMPARHGPPGGAVALPETMGSMLEFEAGANAPRYRMYISGDTLVYEDIEAIPRRYPDIDLALLHLGGTRILGVVKVTMDGKDGVKMLQLVAPHHAIPIHYNDYDVFKSPLSEFQQEVKAAGLDGKVTYLKHGDTYKFRLRKP